MGKLCVYLPPFASDYAGACASLFDLDCLIAINDAGCCTYHYAYIDEPRWNENVRPIFSTTLRNTDAILGTDHKVIAAISEVSDEIAQQMTAVVGTPVPAIIGMDTEGIAAEIEYRTKRPAFGFNTTGFSYYDRGILAAGRALINRFAVPEKPRSGSGISVNLVGMTPLDYGNTGNDLALAQRLEATGIEIGCRFFMGMTTDQLKNCPHADLNLAVSAAGVGIARYLKWQYGTPWLAGFPIGERYAGVLMDRIRLAAENGVSGSHNGIFRAECGSNQHRILIVADQVIGNSLREELELLGETRAVDVASFFGWYPELSRTGDVSLRDEKQYLMLLKSGKYELVLGDPCLFEVPPITDGRSGIHTAPIIHPAVSGKLRWQEMPVLSGPAFEEMLSDCCQLNR